MEVRRRIKRAIIEAGVLTIVVGTFVWYFDLLDDDEDKHAAEEVEKEEEGEEGEEGEEEEVEIPETMPEDAIFIPLGLTHQRPQTFYKGSDPEWQSFVKFRRNRDRETKVRSRLHLLRLNSLHILIIF